MIIKVVIYGSCFAADDFAPSQKLRRQRIFCSSQSVEVNRSYIVGKKIGVPKSSKYHPPKKHTYTKTHIYPNTHTHTHNTHIHTIMGRGGRSKLLGGWSEHNVLCTLSRFALFLYRTTNSNSFSKLNFCASSLSPSASISGILGLFIH